MDDLDAEAKRLDAEDPLAAYRDRFLPADGVVAYLDGNSLGRPLRAAADRVARFVHDDWGTRLIRGWDEGWIDLPQQLGDRIGRIALGAAPGQVVVADSTTVLLYKLARAAVDHALAAGRDEIVVDTDNFPTDRYVLEGIAAERGAVLRWITSDPASGVTPEQVAAVVGPRTALVLLSHVAYRSGFLADAPAITRIAHDAGALVCWDLSHSVGSVPLELDAWGADLAVGCSYKYLNGGPGSPAFGYLATRHLGVLAQPVQGWFGHRVPFEMGPGHEPAPDVRALLSGTPPVFATVPLQAGLDLLEEAGIAAVRAKSVALTGFALRIADALLVPHGVEVATPRDPDRRGGHVTLQRAGFAEVTARLWARGVIPDFRAPDGIRIGLAPLSTSFAELLAGLRALAGEL
ncbi:aminotransferase class V-fold PLP-dependent enzyme [Pseudonocardia sp. C8]|uniref:kynureninase n=1 Tax=Pseudonocardia sp. C8 TaxID=2762759 RepID=UPI001642936A|nr:aminotransferase class V-fold PLP-dependent enzyme [Pseudonocardia sp. C8]